MLKHKLSLPSPSKGWHKHNSGVQLPFQTSISPYWWLFNKYCGLCWDYRKLLDKTVHIEGCQIEKNKCTGCVFHGRDITQRIIHFHVKFCFNWVLCILSGNLIQVAMLRLLHVHLWFVWKVARLTGTFQGMWVVRVGAFSFLIWCRFVTWWLTGMFIH